MLNLIKIFIIIFAFGSHSGNFFWYVQKNFLFEYLLSLLTLDDILDIFKQVYKICGIFFLRIFLRKAYFMLFWSTKSMSFIIWFTDDVTPPSLRWIGSPPTLTNGSISLSWTTDEAVTSLCTVHSPVKDKNESCNNEWVGTDLRNGEYSLTVKMVDGSGNKAQAIHYWNNSMKTCVFLLNSSSGIWTWLIIWSNSVNSNYTPTKSISRWRYRLELLTYPCFFFLVFFFTIKQKTKF